MSNIHRDRRTDLFLVRVWRRSDYDAHETSVESRYTGRVQRLVDGEAFEFSDWHTLIDLLVAMLSAKGGPNIKRKSIGEREDE